MSIFACLLTSALLGAVAMEESEPAKSPPAYQLETGWTWLLEPKQLPTDWFERTGWMWTKDGVRLTLEFDEAHGLLTTLRYAPSEASFPAAALEYRVLLFRAGASEPLESRGWGRTGRPEVIIENPRFERLDDPRELAWVSLAMLTLDGRRERAEQAMAAAHEKGARVLPLPIVGERYEFEMPTLPLDDAEGEGGDLITAEALRGKVIVIDFWATWCMPCIEKMPALKKVHEKYRDEGLVIIGINMDEDVEVAREAIRKHQLDWHHVHAPQAANGHDRFWREITDITSLPRFFVIDRAGVLREDVYPHDIGSLVAPYLKQAEEVAER